jgi:hypothetical protein
MGVCVFGRFLASLKSAKKYVTHTKAWILLLSTTVIHVLYFQYHTFGVAPSQGCDSIQEGGEVCLQWTHLSDQRVQKRREMTVFPPKAQKQATLFSVIKLQREPYKAVML